MFTKFRNFLTLSVLALSTTALAEIDFTPLTSKASVPSVKDLGPQHVFNTSNTVVLRGEISNDSTSKALTELMQIKGDTAYLFLSSPGGSVIAGLKFIDGMRGLGKRIVCVTDFSASMSFVILQACHDRLVFNSSIIMQHVPSMGARGEYPNFKAFVGLLDRVTEQTDRAQAKRMGISVEEFRNRIANDYWLFGGDAVKAKAADSVTLAQCSADLIEKRVSQNINLLFFSINVVWSGCPLITAPLSVEAGNAGGNRRVMKELDRVLNFRENIVTSPQDYKYDLLGRVPATTQD